MNPQYSILIVDDDQDLASNLKDILESEGYDTAAANNGTNALALCRKQTFQVALVDIRLPDMPGDELIRRLEGLSSQMEYILITGHASLESAIEAVRHEKIVSYEIKPLTMSRLLPLLKQIIDRKQLEQELRESEEKYRNLFESSGDGLVTTDLAGNISDVNQAYLDMLGYSREEILNLTIQALTPSRWRKTDQSIIRKMTLTRGYSAEYEKEYIRKDGTTFPVSIKAWPIRDNQGEPIGMWGIARDISRSKKLEAKLRTLSIQDDLTKLYNRRGFFALGEQQWKTAKRTKTAMGLIFADLDDMKRINDTLGHEQGDRALKETATILKKTFRETDIIARIGGDEFAILSMQNAEDDTDILTHRLKRNLDEANRNRAEEFRLSLSLGIAYSDPQHTCSLVELLSTADLHMYKQKDHKNKSK